MYEFPNVLQQENTNPEKVLKDWNLIVVKQEELGEEKHIFSHIEWNMKGWRIQVKQQNNEFEWVKKEEILQKYAIPEAFRYYKNRID